MGVADRKKKKKKKQKPQGDSSRERGGKKKLMTREKQLPVHRSVEALKKKATSGSQKESRGAKKSKKFTGGVEYDKETVREKDKWQGAVCERGGKKPSGGWGGGGGGGGEWCLAKKATYSEVWGGVSRGV